MAQQVVCSLRACLTAVRRYYKMAILYAVYYGIVAAALMTWLKPRPTLFEALVWSLNVGGYIVCAIGMAGFIGWGLYRGARSLIRSRITMLAT